jgi:sec-independent protein translocase protein TatA
MGLDNPIHIAFLLILLLLVFGAKRLPEIGRSLGTGMRGFKESLSGESTQASLTISQREPVPITAASPAETPGTSSAGELGPPAA